MARPSKPANHDQVPASALPSLRQLQFLLAVKSEGSFLHAADAVGVTQPTLSAGIKELETALGIQLIERGRSGAVLTSAGEVAAEHAANAIQEAEAVVRGAREASRPFTGVFRLGAIPTIAPYVLPKLLPALKSYYPNLSLHLREDMTGRLVESLRARSLDAAIIALPYEAPGIEAEIVAMDEFLLVAPKNHPLVRQNSLQPADMAAQEVLLLEDGHCMRDHALSICKLKPRGGERNTDFGATSLQTLVQMVAGGMGVTLAPRLAVEGGVTAGVDVSVRPFTTPVYGRSIGVAWRDGAAREPEARLLAQVLKRAVLET
jgi:LysR family transcriptional regulator, hydrogen peroxide-inducible genes activator